MVIVAWQVGHAQQGETGSQEEAQGVASEGVFHRRSKRGARLSEEQRLAKVTHATSPTWLAWPTLSEASFGHEAVGAVHHAGELARIIGRWGDVFTAELVIEEAGQYAGAVRLLVGGEQVGSVPHDASDEYRTVIETLRAGGNPATCRVSATEGQLAPWLLILGRPAIRQDNDPFLPPAGSGDYVTLSTGERERLEATLNSRAKTKHVVRTASLTIEPSSLGVWIEGVRVGNLPGEFPRVSEAARQGFPLTCRVVLRRDPDRGFRLQAFLPH